MTGVGLPWFLNIPAWVHRWNFDAHKFPSCEWVLAPLPSRRHGTIQPGTPQTRVLVSCNHRYMVRINDFPHLAASLGLHEVSIEDPDGYRMLNRDITAAPLLPRDSERGKAGWIRALLLALEIDQTPPNLSSPMRQAQLYLNGFDKAFRQSPHITLRFLNYTCRHQTGNHSHSTVAGGLPEIS